MISDSLKQNKHRWIYGGLVVLMMILVFCFSAMSGRDSAAMSGRITEAVLRIVYPEYRTLPQQERYGAYRLMSFLVRKGAHFTEYAFLGALVMLFLNTYSIRRRPLFAFLFSALYAASDEWHQSFVAGRGPMIRDVAIDALGAIAGILLILLLLRAFRKNKQTTSESS